MKSGHIEGRTDETELRAVNRRNLSAADVDTQQPHGESELRRHPRLEVTAESTAVHTDTEGVELPACGPPSPQADIKDMKRQIENMTRQLVIKENDYQNVGGAVANRLRRRTSDQTVLGSNPAWPLR